MLQEEEKVKGHLSKVREQPVDQAQRAHGCPARGLLPVAARLLQAVAGARGQCGRLDPV